MRIDKDVKKTMLFQLLTVESEKRSGKIETVEDIFLLRKGTSDLLEDAEFYNMLSNKMVDLFQAEYYEKYLKDKNNGKS